MSNIDTAALAIEAAARAAFIAAWDELDEVALAVDAWRAPLEEYDVACQAYDVARAAYDAARYAARAAAAAGV